MFFCMQNILAMKRHLLSLGMKSKLIHVFFLFVVAVFSFSLFNITDWKPFLRSNYYGELLALGIGLVLTYIVISKSKIETRQNVLSKAIIIANSLLSIIPFIDPDHAFDHIFIFQAIHLASFIILCNFFKMLRPFFALYCFMIYSSAIAYRLNTICYNYHDSEGIGVGNVALIISLFVLSLLGSVAILAKRYQ